MKPPLHASLLPSLALCLSLAACSDRKDSPATGPAGPLEIAVSIPPQAFLVERIAGDKAIVHTFVGAGQDPHHFSATPKQVMTVGGARAFLTIGMPFEETLTAKLRGSLPQLTIVDLAEGIEHDVKDGHHHHDHHGDHEEAAPEAEEEEEEHADDNGNGNDNDNDNGNGHDHHDHGNGDPHIWLSPVHLIDLAKETCATLVGLDPANKTAYEDNLALLIHEIASVESDLHDLLDPHSGGAFYVYHPAFAHFGEVFHLKQKSIEGLGGNPTPKELMQVVSEAREHGIQVVFTQPQFDASSAKTVADAIGGRVVSIDPLDPDVLTNLETIGKALADSFGRN